MGFDPALTACVVCDERLKELREMCGDARPRRIGTARGRATGRMHGATL